MGRESLVGPFDGFLYPPRFVARVWGAQLVHYFARELRHKQAPPPSTANQRYDNRAENPRPPQIPSAQECGESPVVKGTGSAHLFAEPVKATLNATQTEKPSISGTAFAHCCLFVCSGEAGDWPLRLVSEKASHRFPLATPGHVLLRGRFLQGLDWFGTRLQS